MNGGRLMRRRLGLLLLALGLTAGCGSVPDQGGARPPQDRGGPRPVHKVVKPRWHGDGPPVVVVRDQDDRARLRPYTFCWLPAGGCVDGMPPRRLPDLGLTMRPPVMVWFRMDDWRFWASQHSFGSLEHVRKVRIVRVVRVDEHTWRLPPTGPPGCYRIDLAGRGPQGDLVVSFAVRRAIGEAAPSTLPVGCPEH